MKVGFYGGYVKNIINVSILESVRKDIFAIQDLLKMWQKQTDFHGDPLNRADRICDMALSKLETVIPEKKEEQNEN